MKLCLIGHEFRYELEKLIRLFLPFEKIEFSKEEADSDSVVVTKIYKNTATVKVNIFEKSYIKTAEIVDVSDKKETELKLATLLYQILSEIFSYESQWGILTGVRPAKLYSNLLNSIGKEETEKYFKNTLRVSDKKISLCNESYKSEEKITALSRKDSFSLYISIPFCPTRCTYCSFVSHSIDKADKLIPFYLEKLCDELKITAEIAKNLNLKLETIYIGGGTPTTLNVLQLQTLMSTVRENFDLKNLREYTVEAGRPDTITEDKLKVIKDFGATRISINPQTMNDSVLETIGRRHTAQDTIKAFNLARSVGHNNINMDLIAGLPNDSFESFKDTLDKILTLSPESVTVHSLSMKRASTLNKNAQFSQIESGTVASQMVDFAKSKLSENGIFPYYMYRQSKTVGNLENVGYSKKGYECLYNVFIMDETHTILACGASAVTKLKQPDGRQIERIFNFKYPYEYINNFDEIIRRKAGIKEFYDKFSFGDK